MKMLGKVVVTIHSQNYLRTENLYLRDQVR